MRIYKMTATFGKLENATLELKPGLNVITAPNEWGKSTWCAFLSAMLYGLDTREKSTRGSLADKERFAPWSGAPMAGRIDLNWQGRDITIERKTGRRIPLGEFQAYETASGLPVPELTAANCGQTLLGVEQSVFRRSSFIRHGDLPVTQDEALRRRLHALVTTGDDSGAADRLGDSLKELKNRCRYNRTGLLPQAEETRKDLENKLAEQEMLDQELKKLETRLEENDLWNRQLRNHAQTLAYQKMEADAVRVEQARVVMEASEIRCRKLEQETKQLPNKEETEHRVRELRSFRELWNSIQLEARMAPSQPQKPQLSGVFAGLTEEEARNMVRRDAKQYIELAGTKAPVLLVCVGIFGILAAFGLVFLRAYVFAAVAAAAAAVALVWGVYEKISIKRQIQQLLEKHGGSNWKRWMEPVEEYAGQLSRYRDTQKEYEDITGDLEVRLMVLRNKRDALCGFREPEELLREWEQALAVWEEYVIALQDAERSRSHYETLSAMVHPVEKPDAPDTLSYTEEETRHFLAEREAEQQRLQNRMGQYQGRLELLGSREELLKQHKQICSRIALLEETEKALVIAQKTLAEAKAELQRRFAPRITRRAQAFLAEMTDGRYHSLTMGEDFALQAGAGQEVTLSDAIWRSDGTVDQLYLALRLAVAEELIPQAPLVLDDALVRFDDKRMQAAVGILEKMSRKKQVILFTCQGREAQLS